MTVQPKTPLDILRDLIVNLPQTIGIVELKDSALAIQLAVSLDEGRKILKLLAKEGVNLVVSREAPRPDPAPQDVVVPPVPPEVP